MTNSINVSDAVLKRCSTRAFRPDPVSSGTVREILETALRAPSGGNLQPWQVHIVTGSKYREIVEATQKQFDITPSGRQLDHHPYPLGLNAPYTDRRRNIGRQLYEVVGVARGDKAGKLKYLRRNFDFFGAPVGMFFTIERQMEPLQWTDLGIFIQTVMLLAVEYGLATCCQGAWSLFTPIVRKSLNLSDHHIVACGMSLGFADENAPINTLRSERADLGEIATFHD